LGEHAIIVGSPRTNGADLRFVTMRLAGPPAMADMFTLTGTSQSDQRSHAFAYRPENATDGLLGLPVVGEVEPGDTDAHGGAIVFLRSRSLVLEDAGTLASGTPPANDACRASCADWYGNARPLFIGDRVFALLGYEIVEGTLAGGRLLEQRRASFAPTPQSAETLPLRSFPPDSFPPGGPGYVPTIAAAPPSWCQENIWRSSSRADRVGRLQKSTASLQGGYSKTK
jgi:hypothetical protein